MYNSYKKGTEAWYLMQDAIAASQTLDEGKDAAEEVLERAIDMVDDADQMVIDAEEERNQAQRDLEEAEETIRSLQKRLEACNLAEMTRVLKNIILYCQTTLEKIQPEEPDDQGKQEGPQEDNS